MNLPHIANLNKNHLFHWSVETVFPSLGAVSWLEVKHLPLEHFLFHLGSEASPSPWSSASDWELQDSMVSQTLAFPKLNPR